MPGNWKKKTFVQTIFPDSSIIVILLLKMFIVKNLTDFRKTVETGVDPRVLFGRYFTDYLVTFKHSNLTRTSQVESNDVERIMIKERRIGRWVGIVLIKESLLSRLSVLRSYWTTVTRECIKRPVRTGVLKNRIFTRTQYKYRSILRNENDCNTSVFCM